MEEISTCWVWVILVLFILLGAFALSAVEGQDPGYKEVRNKRGSSDCDLSFSVSDSVAVHVDDTTSCDSSYSYCDSSNNSCD